MHKGSAVQSCLVESAWWCWPAGRQLALLAPVCACRAQLSCSPPDVPALTVHCPRQQAVHPKHAAAAVQVASVLRHLRCAAVHPH